MRMWPSLCGADVALLPLSMADHGEGELQVSAKTELQDAQGNRIPTGGATSVETSLILMNEKNFSKRM